MNVRPSLLCPIDFSDASAASLRYAAAIAEHFVTRLIVLTVEDPLPAAMDVATGAPRTRRLTERALAAFARQTLGASDPMLAMCEYDVAMGTPAVEILRVARERSCDLIVMSSHGNTGGRTLRLGSTTDRVLRKTTRPVLVTPQVNPGPVSIEDARRLIGRIVVPVDLSPASRHQAAVAHGLGKTLHVPVVLVHVIAPIGSQRAALPFTGLPGARESAAQEELGQLLAAIPSRLAPDALVMHGDPAEETAALARSRHAGLVVVTLHSSPLSGPRMGSVTHRLLCLTSALVLALPPKDVRDAAHDGPAPPVVGREIAR